MNAIKLRRHGLALFPYPHKKWMNSSSCSPLLSIQHNKTCNIPRSNSSMTTPAVGLHNHSSYLRFFTTTTTTEKKKEMNRMRLIMQTKKERMSRNITWMMIPTRMQGKCFSSTSSLNQSVVKLVQEHDDNHVDTTHHDGGEEPKTFHDLEEVSCIHFFFTWQW